MRMKTAPAMMLLVLGCAAMSGCPARAPEKPGGERAAQTAVAGGQDDAPQAALPELPEPLASPYGPVETLGDSFCKALLKKDYQALADHFNTEFLIRVNPKFQNLDDADALRDMQGMTPKVIEDSIREAHAVPATECVVETTELRNCTETAMLAHDSTSGDVTTDSFLAAAGDLGVTECGILQIRETSNAGILYSQIIVGNPGGKWQLLLGM